MEQDLADGPLVQLMFGLDLFAGGFGIAMCCDLVYASAARIAVISPGMKDRLVERGVPCVRSLALMT